MWYVLHDQSYQTAQGALTEAWSNDEMIISRGKTQKRRDKPIPLHWTMNKECERLGWNVVQFVWSPSTFRWKVEPPSSGSKIKSGNKPARYRRQCLANSSTEAVCSSETAINFCRTIRHYNQEKKTMLLWSASELFRPSDRRLLEK
jgi:hypothetical protein